MMTEAKTISVEEAATLLGIGRSAAYQAARNGDIPAIKIGRLWRIPRAPLMRLIDPDAPATDQS